MYYKGASFFFVWVNFLRDEKYTLRNKKLALIHFHGVYFKRPFLFHREIHIRKASDEYF